MSAGSWLRRFGVEITSVAAIVAAVVVPVWPGVYTIDSQAMFEMVQTGQVSDWYSPILVSCWRLVDWLGLPPATIFVATTSVLVVALLATYRLALPRTWAIVATAATVVFPPVYGLLGWVGRDVWFLALLLVVVAALGWASVREAHRRTLVVVALVAAWFAADARQNGFPVLAVAGGAAAWILLAPERRRWFWVLGGSVVVLVGGLALQRAAHVVTVQQDVAPEQALYYQDLLDVSLRLDESQVPPSLLRPDRLERVRRLWSPGEVGAVLFRDDPPVDYRPYRGHEPRTERLRDAWIDLIIEHPTHYAAARLELFGRELGIGGAPPGAWYAASDSLDVPGSTELTQRFTDLNDARIDVLSFFDSGAAGRGGPLHRPWPYVLLGLVGASAILAAGPRLRVFGALLLALQLSLQAALVIMAPLVELRFELFQIVLGIVAAVVGARVWLLARHERVTASATPLEALEH